MSWQRSPLIQLLREHRGFECQRPCDLVYAQLGVSNEANEKALKPNCLETTDQTFTRVARFCVERGYGPQVLENAILTTSSSTLASWIPRWNDRGYNQVIRPAMATILNRSSVVTSSLFDASRKTDEAFELSGKGDVLIGQGVVFDDIESIGSSELLITSPESIPQGGPNGLGALKLTLRYISEICSMLSTTKHGIFDADFLDTIFAIAVCEHQSNNDQKASKSMQKGLYMALLLAPNHVSLSEWSVMLLRLFCVVSSPPHLPDDTTENRKWRSSSS